MAARRTVPHKKARRSLARKIRAVFLPHKDNGRHPHIFRGTSVLAVLACVVMMEVGWLSQIDIFAHEPAMTASVLPAVITDLTNQEREQSGLGDLQVNALLTEAAQDKADDMAAKGYFAHVSPGGELPWAWITQTGYNYQFAGENLAVNFDDSDAVVSAWMNSPEHRANILDLHYTQIGIGIAQGMYQNQETTFVVQFFATPQAAQAAAAPKQEKPATATAPAVAPAPQHVAQTAPTTPVETAAPSPVPSAPTVLADQSQGRAAPASAWWMRMIASPSTTMNDVLLAVGLFFVVCLALGFLPVSPHFPHPNALVNGTAVAAVMLALIIVNGSVAPGAIVNPPDGEHAAVALSLP